MYHEIILITPFGPFQHVQQILEMHVCRMH